MKPKTETKDSEVSEGLSQMLEDLDMENVLNDENDNKKQEIGITLPLSPLAKIMNEEIKFYNEDVCDTPKISFTNSIKNTLIQETSKQITFKNARNELRKYAQTIPVFKINERQRGYKEGPLKKLSNKLFTDWKSKYCYLKNSTFSFYKNYETKCISGFIDFKRIPAIIGTNKTALCFQ